MPGGGIGRHKGLKILARNGVPVQVRLRDQNYIHKMEDNNKIFDLDFFKKTSLIIFKTLVISFTLVFSISTFISFQLKEIFKSSSLVLIKDKYNLLNNDESSLVSGLSLISGNSTTSPLI